MDAYPISYACTFVSSFSGQRRADEAQLNFFTMIINEIKNHCQLVGTNRLLTALQGIRNGAYAPQIKELRKAVEEGETQKASKIKKGLRAITVSARYEKRRTPENLAEYHPVMVFDIDGLTPGMAVEVRNKAATMERTMAAFLSPSGRGVKILAMTPGNPSRLSGVKLIKLHKFYFTTLGRYYQKELKVKADPSGKDIGRLMYLSYDPDLYLNYREEPMALPPAEDLNDPFIQALQKVEKRMTYQEGNRNVFIYNLLCELNRRGVPQAQAQERCLLQYNLPAEEIISAAQSAYTHTHEHNVVHKKKQTQLKKIEQYLNGRCQLRFNVVLNRIEYREIKPVHAQFAPITDFEENSLYRGLLAKQLSLSQSTLHSILYSDFVVRFDPFHDYFSKLPPWDGATDYISALAASVTTTQQEFWTACLRKWLVAMVAGWLRPEVVNHTMLVLIGPQGIYKTSWSLRLMPPELKRYRYSGMINTRDKDGLFTLSQCGLINNEELEGMTPAELNAFKALMTLQVINERASYGRNKEYLTRRASFIGSGNNSDILSDPTGTRRWLCFNVVNILSAEEYPIPYQGLYAQIKHLLDTGFRYWFDKDEMALLNTSNEPFEQKSVEEEQIIIWFRKPMPEEACQMMTATQIMQKLMEWARVPMSNIKVGRIMKKLGYELYKKQGIRSYKVIVRTFEEVERNKHL